MLVAQNSGSAASGLIVTLVFLALALVLLAAEWKVFVKAGEPGWGSLIPIYNLYLLCKIGGKPGWWFLLMAVPVVNVVVLVLIMLGVAKGFGKSGAYALGLIFLSPFFLCHLAFGGSTYDRSLVA